MTVADAFPTTMTMDAVYTEISAFLGAAVVIGTILVVLGLRLAPRFVKALFRATIRA